ncbi:MAG: bifunctional DNA-formamidopyrimidine glycosylase/DNA-(apurinic or apyrimidinic site) lyase [Chloroflexi bacterium]|nr:bifunctional DNA-formamidopyrimidine glycosylase/DNA-(apurinic or apyrimidinic site) lyase [Chloroflexota bacterium]
MPELPEVETVVRGLRAPLIGRTFSAVWYERERVIQLPDAASFSARLLGQTVRAITRRAKYIVCALDHDYLLLHLRMTGRLYVVPADQQSADDRWLRLRLSLDNGHELRFSDARRFGRAYLTADLNDVFAEIGPEPLEDDFTVEMLQARLRKRHKSIKALLLDQSFLAGVGNIYADEALFTAQIHPLRSAASLMPAEAARLHSSIRAALNAGIVHEGASVNWYRKPDGSSGSSQAHFYVYDRQGQPCLVCGSPIEKIRVAQRGTHFCPNCQMRA